MLALGRRVRDCLINRAEPNWTPPAHAGKATYIRPCGDYAVMLVVVTAIHTLLGVLSPFPEVTEETPMKLYRFPVRRGTLRLLSQSHRRAEQGWETIRQRLTQTWDAAAKCYALRSGASPRKSKAPTRRNTKLGAHDGQAKKPTKGALLRD